MNSLLNDEKITETGATAGVQTLATRPNQPSVYGVGGLSASELKKRFDRLAEKIIEKHNALCDKLGGVDGAASIVWEGEKTLKNLFESITDGYLANILMVDGLSEDSEKSSLADTLKSHLNVLIFLYDYLDAPNQEGVEHISDKFFSKSNGESLSKKLDDAVSKLGDAVLKNPSGTQQISNLLIAQWLKTIGYAEIGSNLTVRGKSTLSDVSMINASAVNMDVEATLTASDISTTYNATIGGDLIVKGTTYTVNQQSVVAWDNIIVTNAYASETGVVDFLLSGLVIDTGNGAGYGILYKPGDDAVVIGKGTLTKTTDSEGHVTDVKFEYNEGQAIPLAARYGSFADNEIPMWDAETNAFVSSGKNIGNIVEDALGDIDTALNSILAIQNNLIGGAT